MTQEQKNLPRQWPRLPQSMYQNLPVEQTHFPNQQWLSKEFTNTDNSGKFPIRILTPNAQKLRPRQSL